VDGDGTDFRNSESGEMPACDIGKRFRKFNFQGFDSPAIDLLILRDCTARDLKFFWVHLANPIVESTKKTRGQEHMNKKNILERIFVLILKLHDNLKINYTES
jgi:hypothetical protein